MSNWALSSQSIDRFFLEVIQRPGVTEKMFLEIWWIYIDDTSYFGCRFDATMLSRYWAHQIRTKTTPTNGFLIISNAIACITNCITIGWYGSLDICYNSIRFVSTVKRNAISLTENAFMNIVTIIYLFMQMQLFRWAPSNDRQMRACTPNRLAT